MRIDYTVQATVDKNILSKTVSSEDILPQVKEGLSKLSDLSGDMSYNMIIAQVQGEVLKYQQEFNTVVMEVGRKNSIARQLAQTLQPTSRGQALYLDNAKMRNQSSVQKLMETMLKGHELLLKIREVFTGQVINTKFIINFDGKMYEIDEKQINMNLVLSRYSGGTQSNPINLAYSLDRDMLKEMIEVGKLVEVEFQDWFTQMWNAKAEYLADLAIKRKRKYTQWWDSKDAEIYQLLTMQEENGRTHSLGTDEYIGYRKSMGGRGGYRSAFYKIGDVGTTQIKFFNFDNGGRTQAANFIRYSMLRDKFNELATLFTTLSGRELGLKLKEFFTEDEKNLSDEVSSVYNKEAQEAFDKFFNL